MTYYTVKGYASARRSLENAMIAEGITDAVERMGFNGAVPGDGIALGSVTVRRKGQAGVNVLCRIHAWVDLRRILNDPEERRYLADKARSYLN